MRYKVEYQNYNWREYQYIADEKITFSTLNRVNFELNK